ncbi:S41 family peptidase [Chitinophaga rhizophila]|uniref:S41 family peptidase n=1 Tax=Chitinophaga rhizophila TaxID=2866212 RepID=A0ABS7GFH9_9BACT|nr:S41 family peptidase [Chitinophaga rhizophila]MBW8685995.1 S41 family peptidase [Chitinophaga rhizophila]
MKKVFQLIILTNLLCITAKAQWRAVSYPITTVNKWNAASQPGIFTSSPIPFPDQREDKAFIISNNEQPAARDLRTLLADAGLDTNAFCFRRISLPDSFTLNYDAGKVNFTYFTRNVKELLLAGLDKDGHWHYRMLPVSHDGFQLPVSTFLSTWEYSKRVPYEEEKIVLTDLILGYTPAKASERAEMAVGDLTVDEVSVTPGRNVFAWIDSLTGQPQETYTRMFNDYSSYFYTRPPAVNKYEHPATFEEFGLNKGYLTGYVNFIPDNDKADEAKLVAALMKRFIALYPFYEQRGISQTTARADIDKVFSKKGKSYTEVLTDLKSTFRKLYPDPHLDMTLPVLSANKMPARLKNGPLRLRTIGEDVVVAAVLNDQYRDSIPLGAKVMALDGKPVYAAGDPNLLLYKKENDTLNIRLQTNSIPAVRTFHIPYSLPVRVSRNFVPLPGMERLPGDVLLVRIGNWKGEEYYRFLNAFYAHPEMKGIIIDLRGNGGGYSADVLKTLSLFTDQAYSIGSRHYPWFDESMLITPARKELRCNPATKVIILADKSTACASEIFILGMKKRKHTFVVGDAPTMGAIASPTIFRFPSGLTIQLHTGFRQFLFDPAVYTEGKGIAPDIWVARTHARDLAPYEDKLLQYAKQLISL